MALRGQSVEGFAYFAIGFLLTARLLLGKSKLNGFIYFLKYFFFLNYCLIATTVNTIFFIFRPCHANNLIMLLPWTKWALWMLGIKQEIRCKEEISDKGAVVVINHQNTIDVLILLSIWEKLKKCRIVAKLELFFLGTFGLGLWLGGAVPINRRSRQSSLKTLKNIENIVQKEKTKILIFVEGTRNKEANTTRTLLPFKKGAFHIAIACQVPIIPVVISPYLFLRGGPNRFFGKGTLISEVLPAIETKGLTEKDVNALIDKTYKMMQAKFMELFKEVEN